MDKLLKKIQHDIESGSRVYELLDTFIYEVDRYKQECSIAMIFSFDELDIDKIKMITRKSDIVLDINKNALFIIFNHTSESGGIKATQKILLALNPNFNSKIYASLLSCSPDTTERIMVRNLFNLIEFAIDNGHENEVLDISYLDGVY